MPVAKLGSSLFTLHFLLDSNHYACAYMFQITFLSPLQEVADEFWQKHKQRNDSMVESLFLGQFKSTLVCPVCQETSVVFDPFLSMSIPLPRKMISRAVIFIPQDPSKVPVKVREMWLCWTLAETHK